MSGITKTTLRKKPEPEGAVNKIDEATRHIREAKRMNEQMQNQYVAGSASWHQCESIDDKLHDALAALGE